MRVSSSRRIFVGDVHGHYDALMRLLETIAPGAEDQVYFVGDLIDRGPKSAQVIQFVREHGYGCVMGNHEHMLLEAFPESKVSQHLLQIWLQSGGYTTIASYATPELLMENLQWLQSLPTHLDLGDIWLVHAGVHPHLPLDAQTVQQFCWIREEFHGTPEPYFSDKLIITGHTITFTLPGVPAGAVAKGRGWLNIDTGAYHPKSGWLTAVDMTQEQVYQVNVFQNTVRSMPLAEAAVEIEPGQMYLRRQLIQTL
ncbi:metallophosphoesterase family protein [Leptolyngbya ohadii]|uniref:metallophosphoesterase family protein n=1 Tax=Leptolyngbya ohadii TaxID=1962290 RepID=UPI000B5A2071|nr:metallophosphoesterase family protein [Leptolyngbya ohadii]